MEKNPSLIKQLERAVGEMKEQRNSSSSESQLEALTYALHSLKIGASETLGGSLLTLLYPFKELGQIGLFGIRSSFNTFTREPESRKDKGQEIISQLSDGSRETTGNFLKSAGVGLLGVGDLIGTVVLTAGTCGPINIAGAVVGRIVPWGRSDYRTVHEKNGGGLSNIEAVAYLPATSIGLAALFAPFNIAAVWAINDIVHGGKGISQITQGALGLLGLK